jgi:hypothetical protein
MSTCPTARKRAESARNLPRALYYKLKQDKETTFYSTVAEPFLYPRMGHMQGFLHGDFPRVHALDMY